jgi:hypothetical protein
MPRLYFHTGRRDSSNRYSDVLDDRDSIPGRGKRFFSIRQSPYHIWGLPTLAVERPERESNHLSPSSDEVKNDGAISPLPHTSSWLHRYICPKYRQGKQPHDEPKGSTAYIQSDSKFLPWFPFIRHGNPDNNIEPPCMIKTVLLYATCRPQAPATRRVVQWTYEYDDIGSCISGGPNQTIGVRLSTEAGSFLCDFRLDLGDHPVDF